MVMSIQRSSVMAIGDLLWDTTVQADMSLIEELKLLKGNSQQADRQTVENGRIRALNTSDESAQTPGGSASNALKVIARLGNNQVRLCALVADDEIGKRAAHRLKQHGIELLNVEQGVVSSEDKTGRVNSFITKEGSSVERTMQVFLDIAAKFTADSLKEEHFKFIDYTLGKSGIVETEKTFEYIFLDGYEIYDKGMLEKGRTIANKLGCKTILGLPCASVVRDHINAMVLHANNVNYCFGNREEFSALTGADHPVESIKCFNPDVSVILTDSAEGCYVRWGGHCKVSHFKAIPVPFVKDTTGAGDFFAGGVMTGVMAGLDEEECIKIGNLAASYVIQHLGADLPDATWSELTQMVKEIFTYRSKSVQSKIRL